jgi:hypothetical protein
MLTDQKIGPAMIGLPAAKPPPVLQLCPPQLKEYAAPPIVGGFQMPLPGISSCNQEVEPQHSLDWHYYLGSK